MSALDVYGILQSLEKEFSVYKINISLVWEPTITIKSFIDKIILFGFEKIRNCVFKFLK